jgi:hypothetical protein
LLCALAGCTAVPQAPDIDADLEGLALTEYHPALILPGSEVDLVGASFVDGTEGLALMVIDGDFPDATESTQHLHVELPARFVDATHLALDAAGLWNATGGHPGRITGVAAVAVDSAIDHKRHATAQIPIDVTLVPSLQPRLDSVAGGTIFVNSLLDVTGDGLLLGGGEGETHAVVDGCFLPDGAAGPCASGGKKVSGVEVVVSPAAPWDRAHGKFAFSPAIAGIHPGAFSGTVSLKNLPPDPKSVASSQPMPLAATLQKPMIATFSPSAASLGQIVAVAGGGFAGGTPGTVTLVHLVGQFSVEGTQIVRPVDLELVPSFVDGGHLRYVLDEADDLGHLIDLRTIAGTFTGTAQPLVIDGNDQEAGAAANVTLGIAHVKQVIYVNFLPSYSESLRRYGLHAADDALRARILAVATRDYAGVNVEWRTAPPDDFALYSEVDVLGPDPNGEGLFGYDNTPGKDVGNTRLFDRIGGVNAQTQADDFPGYGGIFAEEFLGFSQHPPPSVMPLSLPGAAFDSLFDPVRPDAGGRAVTFDEVQAAPVLTDGSACPAADRPTQIACAIFTLGNLIGTTLTHETGHSLGLADPFGDNFHDLGDLPNRLMEVGGDRPFEERAEIAGQGPGLFCVDEFAYLQQILPAPAASDPKLMRPGCGAL